MKKIIEILLCLIIVGYFIYELIMHPLHTLINMGEGLGILLVLFGLIYLHLSLEDKNYIDWDNYKELTTLCRWLCLASWLFFVLFIVECFSYPTSFSFLLLIFSAFSFWTYFSLILAKRNALFLVRSYLICNLFILLINFVDNCHKTIEIQLSTLVSFSSLFEIVDFISVGLLIALLVKGLLITFNTKVKDLFKGYRISYVSIAVITIFLTGFFRMRNTTITFNQPQETSQETLFTK